MCWGTRSLFYSCYCETAPTDIATSSATPTSILGATLGGELQGRELPPADPLRLGPTPADPPEQGGALGHSPWRGHPAPRRLQLPRYIGAAKAWAGEQDGLLPGAGERRALLPALLLLQVRNLLLNCSYYCYFSCCSSLVVTGGRLTYSLVTEYLVGEGMEVEQLLLLLLLHSLLLPLLLLLLLLPTGRGSPASQSADR